jgi:hypothetical protein
MSDGDVGKLVTPVRRYYGAAEASIEKWMVRACERTPLVWCDA